MVTAISEGISISVETKYHGEFSSPETEEFLFIYVIHIKNLSENTIQLRSRYWYIFDACGRNREVEGEGVIGLFPIIQPGESYSYESGCKLSSEIGSMRGYYTMKKLPSGTEFQVTIPQFELIVPYKLT